MPPPAFIPLPAFQKYSAADLKRRAADFYADLRRRRTVRDFSDRPVPREVIENCLRTAETAPNGANMQPWHFVVVSDPAIKRYNCVEAEKGEHEFYAHKAPQEWLDALAPLGTDANKPFLRMLNFSSGALSKLPFCCPLGGTPSILDASECLQRTGTSHAMINDWSRIGAAQFHSRAGEYVCGSFPRLVNPLVRQVLKFPYPEADIVAVWIEFFALSHRVEDTEEGRGVGATTSGPLPTQCIVRQIGICERVPEPSGALLPGDQQILDQE